MLSKSPSATIFMIAFSFILLSRGEVRADFGSGTITFDESTYQLYHNQSGTFVEYPDDTNAGATTGVSNTGVLTVSDDQAIPYNAWFKADTDVYVRIGFSRDADNDIDSTDINAVFEDTSRNGYNVEYANTYSPIENARAYYSDDVSWDSSRVVTDAVESGFENQAGAYFIRSAKNGDTGYTQNGGNDDWTQFIIEYSGSVTSATGEIWDIDFSTVYERFDVKAYSDSDATIQIGTTQRSPLGVDGTEADSYDAKPWAWSFDGIGNIAKIVFTKTGTTDAGGNTLAGSTAQFPLAFNNFNPVSAIGYFTPEPSSLLAFGGIFSLTVLRRRRRSASA